MKDVVLRWRDLKCFILDETSGKINISKLGQSSVYLLDSSASLVYTKRSVLYVLSLIIRKRFQTVSVSVICNQERTWILAKHFRLSTAVHQFEAKGKRRALLNHVVRVMHIIEKISLFNFFQRVKWYQTDLCKNLSGGWLEHILNWNIANGLFDQEAVHSWSFRTTSALQKMAQIGAERSFLQLIRLPCSSSSARFGSQDALLYLLYLFAVLGFGTGC